MNGRATAYRAVALAVALGAATLLARELMTLLLAVALTVILALPLSAAATFAQRHGLRRGAGVLAALVLLTGVAGAIGYLVVPEFVSQARDFASRLPSTVSALERWLGMPPTAPSKLTAGLAGPLRSALAHPGALGGQLASLLGSVAQVAAVLVAIVIAATTIALRPDPLLDGALGLLPAAQRPRAREVLARIRTAWLGWLTAIGIDMLLLGTLLFLGLTLVGLPFALGFALFSALMTVIPNYGSIISAIPPLLVGLSHSPAQGLLVLAVYVIVNQIEGNVILPLVMARTVDLHPALVSIGVVVMASLFGLIGVLISIPLLSLTLILVQALWVEPLEARR